MATFEYLALNHEGNEIKGVFEAETQRQVRDQLRANALIPVSLRKVGEYSQRVVNKKSRGIKGANVQVKYTEIVLFTRQLAILLASGMPLEQALHGVMEETEKKTMKGILAALREQVREGKMLAAGLDCFPRIFNSMYRATVRAGENSGHLDQVLEDLAEYTEKQQIMSRKLQQALIYPGIMLFVCFSIVGFLLTYVVPQLVAVFAEQNQSLPSITSAVIFLSNGLKQHGISIFILSSVLILWFKWQLRVRVFKRKWDAMLLKLPIFGRSIRTVNTARYSRTFGILFSAGLPVLESMAAASKVVMCLPIQDSLVEAEQAVREGVGISKALKATGYFPSMSLHLIASGEVSGQLNTMLIKSASIQDREVEGLINALMALFEPVVTIVMGFLIGAIVIAVLLPVFNMSQLVQ